MFASRRIGTPSAVDAGRRRSASAPAAGRRSSAWCAARASSSAVGSTITSLADAVDDHELPRLHQRRLALCRPTTAGTSSDRARIAV